MKFTVTFVTLLSITSSWAVLAKRVDEPKDKREAPTGYHQSASSSYQAPSLGQGDASAISVGAGYSIGGAKPSYSFGGHGQGSGLQLSSESLQSGHGGTIQLAPITLQPGQDISQIMSQLQHSLGSGALQLQPSNSIAEFHESSHVANQEAAYPQFQQYAAPQYQQYQLAGQISSAPSYADGTKGLSSYQTGPVLFNPSQLQEQSGQQAALSYAVPSGHSASDAGALSLGGAGHSLAGLSLGSGYSLGGAAPSGGSGYSLAGLGHSLGGAGLSFDGTGYTLGGSGHSLGSSGQVLGGSGYSLGSLGGSGHSLGGSEQSLAGYSLGGAGHSQGNSGHSLGGSGYSLGGSGGHSYGGSGISLGSSGSSHGGPGQSFGGSGSSSGAYYKASSGRHGAPGKSSFKPSTFLGASIPNESSFSGSHGPSFPSFSGSHNALSLSGHGHSFPGFPGFSGSSKQISPLYTKSEGSSFDSAGAYSSAGNLASPPGTTYGFPTSSYPGAVHAASSAGSQHYSSKYPSSFGEGSSSYKSPGASYSSLTSHSSGPKYGFSGHSPSSRHGSHKDSHGAHSETSYNTIKYSEELKPRVH